jgi:hypothetical protein
MMGIEKPTNSIVEHILKIRQRTVMYIGQKSIYCLKAYLDGWCFRDYESITDIGILIKFQEWIEDKYDKKNSHSWCGIILLFSNDEHDALDNFFKDFNEFLIEIKYNTFPNPKS